MSFSSRKYDFYLIFGDAPEGSEFWRRNEWSEKHEHLFGALVGLSPEAPKTGIRVLEYAKKEETDEYMSEVKLGRLKWDKKSHDKWTLEADDKRFFNHFESWTPIWTVCEKTDNAPDVYLSVWYEKHLGNDKTYQFDYLITIAVAHNLQHNPKELVQTLAEQLQAKRAVYNTRTWGRGKPDETRTWAFANWVQDTSSHGIYRKGKSLNLHDTPFADIVFEPYWEIIY